MAESILRCGVNAGGVQRPGIDMYAGIGIQKDAYGIF